MSRSHLPHRLSLAAALVTVGAVVLIPGIAAAPPSSTGPWNLTGNAGTNPGMNFVGTTDNKPLNFRVNNKRAFRLEPGSIPNVIGGGATNAVTPGKVGSTIGGGGDAGVDFCEGAGNGPNMVTVDFGTVGGGTGNVAGGGEGTFIGGGCSNTASGDLWPTIAGGNTNTASGGETAIGGGSGNTASGSLSTIQGGIFNTSSGRGSSISGGVGNTAGGEGSTIGGGSNNGTSADFATIGGGSDNTASGTSGTVPGGVQNEAAGSLSFAAGNRAKANDDGTFIWADSQGADMESSAANQFIVRANGNIFFQNDSTLADQGGFINTSTGGFLSTGGAWTNTSDRDAKEGFNPVDGQQVLDGIAELPITYWDYKAEGPSVKHIGPTGQDFQAAFGLGEDGKHIATVDADGVALAAIQALNQRVEKQQAAIAELSKRLAGRGSAASPNSWGAWIVLTSIVSSLMLLLGAGLGRAFARRKGAMA
jgi:hypothetical protein